MRKGVDRYLVLRPTGRWAPYSESNLVTFMMPGNKVWLANAQKQCQAQQMTMVMAVGHQTIGGWVRTAAHLSLAICSTLSLILIICTEKWRSHSCPICWMSNEEVVLLRRAEPSSRGRRSGRETHQVYWCPCHWLVNLCRRKLDAAWKIYLSRIIEIDCGGKAMQVMQTVWSTVWSWESPNVGSSIHINRCRRRSYFAKHSRCITIKHYPNLRREILLINY